MAFIIMLASAAMAYNFEIIQGGTVDVSSMNSISFDIMFNPDPGGNTFGTYAFNLFYDTSELQFNSATSTPPTPLVELFGPAYQDADGHIANFNGASFAVDPTIATSKKLASVVFNINKPGLVSDGQSDVRFDYDPNYTFTIDGQNVPLTAQNTINGANVVAPEPVSSILFLTGGAVMGIRRFCKKV